MLLLGTPVPAVLATGTLFNCHVCPYTPVQLYLPACTHLNPINRGDNELCQRLRRKSFPEVSLLE